jgi:nephrin, putative (fragment)
MFTLLLYHVTLNLLDLSCLFSTDKPRIVQSPNISKSASQNGSTGKLTCRSQGAPNVTFSWTHEGVPLSKSKATTVILNGRSEPKYSISSTRQLDLITYESMLLIRNVSSTDYGTYECIARNELGFDTVQIDFNHISSPDVPVAIRALNRTTSTVTLKWIPGFDGGLTQTFRIRYRKTAFDSEPYLYSDVFPFNTTRYTIKGLDQNEEYSFSVMAFNDLGKSDYSQDEIKVITLKGKSHDTNHYLSLELTIDFK